MKIIIKSRVNIIFWLTKFKSVNLIYEFLKRNTKMITYTWEETMKDKDSLRKNLELSDRKNEKMQEYEELFYSLL